MNLGEREVHFSQSQIKKITQRFDQYTSDGCMTIQQFKKSMGLLGVGDAQYLSNRIFSLITNCSYCTCEEFVEFLDKINNGTFEEKVQLSFNYLDHEKNGAIRYSDIEVIISEISFVWNFLTGEKISTSELIEWICAKLGIAEQKPITYSEYISRYDQEFNWYEFFNNPAQQHKMHADKQYYASIRNSSNEFKIDQIEEYIRVVHAEIEELLYQFAQQEENQHERDVTESTFMLGPKKTSVQELLPRGDYGNAFRETTPYLNQEQLTRQLQSMHKEQNIYETIASKLEQLSELSTTLFKNKQTLQSGRQKALSRTNMNEEEKKKALKNITKPSKKRRNIIYFGHQNWNIMLNMMLGVRRSLKSHYYKFDQLFQFNEEDLHCKYYHELIYKRNEKSIKEISEIFVDYSPKVFYYIRKFFDIDNYQFLKSIGLQNLIGNLLMGNLSSLSDQTSQGKSGSFIYYTQDSKILVKSISREEYIKLRIFVQQYAHYIKDNPETFLMRIYGLYKMKNKSSNRSIYFIVIGNVFDRDLDIDERYDIKGATHNRQILQEAEDINSLRRDKNIALKDVDLMNNHNRVFNIESDLKERIYRQIVKDTEFLKNNNIIEYSLLVGIHTMSPSDDPKIIREILGEQKNKLLTHHVMSASKKEIYFFGIIDLLSEYTAARRLESNFFSIFNYDISCRDPGEYFDRFKNFIYKYVFSS